jgi:ketosteroid isomerase-like protein
MLSRIFVIALAGAALVGCTTTKPAVSTASDEAAILKIEKDMAASNTTAAATATWDKDVVLDDMLTVQPKIAQYVGLEAAQKGFDPQFAAYSFSVEILRIKIKTDGQLGFAWSTLHLEAKGKSGQPPMSITFRQADAYEKKEGKWALIYQNLSVPFEPKTKKAVFDSKLP